MMLMQAGEADRQALVCVVFNRCVQFCKVLIFSDVLR
jgi:hypothetical protein